MTESIDTKTYALYIFFIQFIDYFFGEHLLSFQTFKVKLVTTITRLLTVKIVDFVVVIYTGNLKVVDPQGLPSPNFNQANQITVITIVNSKLYCDWELCYCLITITLSSRMRTSSRRGWAN